MMSSNGHRFRPRKSLIGMVHVAALPGSPRHDTPVELIAASAAAEAQVFERAGFDAIMIENMHDAPYVHGAALGPETVAAMTRIAVEIASTVEIRFGVQILSGGNRQALSVAMAAGGDFIRCENFVFSHVADEGLLAEAEAGPLLRDRARIGAGHVAVLADLKKKHASHALTADLSLEEAAEAAEFFGADALVITGTATGRPTNPDDVSRVKRLTTLPVVVGSGATPETLPMLFEHADAVIVGSAAKHGGVWSNPVDPDACERLAAAARPFQDA